MHYHIKKSLGIDLLVEYVHLVLHSTVNAVFCTLVNVPLNYEWRICKQFLKDKGYTDHLVITQIRDRQKQVL